jgi:phosphoribosylformylglycinamidine synthase
LYNESKATGGGSAILPTPAIGGVGLLDDWSKSATIGFKSEGDALVLLGHSTGHVGQSLWLDICHGRRAGNAPHVDLQIERKLGELTRNLTGSGSISAAHDVSDGGALVAIAEMAMASGIGVELTLPNVPNPGTILFGEDQGRMLVTSANPQAVIEAASAAGIFAARIGTTGGDAVRGPGFSVAIADLRTAHEDFFPKLMGKELTPEF